MGKLKPATVPYGLPGDKVQIKPGVYYADFGKSGFLCLVEDKGKKYGHRLVVYDLYGKEYTIGENPKGTSIPLHCLRELSPEEKERYLGLAFNQMLC